MSKILFVLEDINKTGSPQTALHIIKTVSTSFDIDLVITSACDSAIDLYRLEEFKPFCKSITIMSLPHLYTKKFKIFYSSYLNRIKRTISKLFETSNYDYVYLNRFDIGGDLAEFISKKYSAQVVFNSLGNLQDKKQSKFFVIRKRENRQKNNLLQYTDYYLAISKKSFFKDSSLKHGKLVYFVDYPEIEPLNEPKAENTTGIIRLGQIGYYVRNKNQLFSLSILKELLSKDVKATLTFIGFETDETSGYLDKIHQFISENNMTDKVIFLDKDFDKKQFFSSIDFLLQPSCFEGTPLTVLEAQYRKVPCLASEAIDDAANLGGLVKIPLEDGASNWAKKIIEEKIDGNKIDLNDLKNKFTCTIKDIFRE